MHRYFVCILGFAVSVLIATKVAHADLIFLQFSGNNASGDVDGDGFSSADWLLEFSVDDSISDSESNPGAGFFSNAIVASSIQIDSTVYELGGSSLVGNVLNEDLAGQEFVFIFPSSGGVMQFATGNNVVYPQSFADPNDLLTAMVGSSVTNSTVGVTAASSVLEFNNSPLVGMTGQTINIFESSVAGTGEINFAISDTSAFSVPEPSSVLLPGFALLLCLVQRRNRLKV